MAGEVLMSSKEVDRYAVVEQVLRRTMRQADAALWLGVSVRQVKRLSRAVREQGTAGVVSQRRGAPSNRSIKPALREHYLSLVREHYGDFGPTLAAEYLAERPQRRDPARLDDPGRPVCHRRMNTPHIGRLKFPQFEG